MDLSGYDSSSNSSNETSKDEYFWQVPQPDFLNPAQELLLKISRVYISTLHHQQLSCKSESISLVVLVNITFTSITNENPFTFKKDDLTTCVQRLYIVVQISNVQNNGFLSSSFSTFKQSTQINLIVNSPSSLYELINTSCQ